MDSKPTLRLGRTGDEDPSPRRRRRSGLLLVVVALAVAAGAAAVAAVLLDGGDAVGGGAGPAAGDGNSGRPATGVELPGDDLGPVGAPVDEPFALLALAEDLRGGGALAVTVDVRPAAAGAAATLCWLAEWHALDPTVAVAVEPAGATGLAIDRDAATGVAEGCSDVEGLAGAWPEDGLQVVVGDDDDRLAVLALVRVEAVHHAALVALGPTVAGNGHGWLATVAGGGTCGMAFWQAASPEPARLEVSGYTVAGDPTIALGVEVAGASGAAATCDAEVRLDSSTSVALVAGSSPTLVADFVL